MNRFVYITSTFVLLILTLACSGGAATLTPEPPQATSLVAVTSATPAWLPTFPVANTPVSTLEYQSPEPAGFPYGAQLNEALPKENLLLARHFYGDTVAQLSGDEFCYDVGIYSDNSYIAISCLPDFTYPNPTGTLDENQAKFLRRWVEKFQSFDEPSIHGLLKLNGTGSSTTEFSDQVSMHALIGEIEWNANGYIHRGGTPSVVFHARSILSNQLNMWLDDSSILKFEVANFPDACLGAPKPDEVCEPITTQGFLIYLVANNLMYEYHTDAFGYDIRPIGEPQIAPTPGAGG